ncbi:MAG TPA: hypothetical protein VFM38_03315 [Candidatus Limnocylindrales bacterium]|nr:hypothetical protein [Candidatus Limnocylindrales bacterium]
MTAQSIVCGACAAEVPYGRLSCPSCGELLASVAGSRRSAASAAARVVPNVLYEPPAAPTAAKVVEGEVSRAPSVRDPEGELPWAGPTATQAAAGGVAATVDDGMGGGEGLFDDEASGLPTWTPSPSTVPWGSAADLNGGRTPAYMPRPGLRQPTPQPPPQSAIEPDALTEPDPWPTPEVRPVDEPRPEPVWPADALAAATAAATVAAGTTPAAAPVPPSGTAPSTATPSPATPSPATPPPAVHPPLAAPVQAFAGPGAYVPPMPITVPAGLPAPAREWAGHPESEAAEGAVAGEKGRRVDPDARERLLEFTRWLSVAGAAFAAVGFLLPWGQVVIGSGDTGYFGRWGIAGPWHIVVALAVLAILGLALIDNKVPVWLRTGIAGLGLGALLLGLVWPYLTLSALGMGPGALIAGIGAAALVVSGILALVTDRHAEASRPV